MARVLLIGLDCASPRLVFDRYLRDLPNLARLIERGAWGPLHSSVPPITVPAWASMLSGYDPGELGLYGFRNRVPGSYTLRLADSRDVARPMVWDTLGAAGRHVCALFVPPSYPPRAIHGELVSCFLTPDATHAHTHPPELADELSARFGPYEPDVAEYRTDRLDALLLELHRQSSQRFAIAKHLLTTRRPEFLAMVDLGLDRFHHAFWSRIDPDDPRHDPNGPHAGAGREYYAFLDREIGQLLDAAGEDTTVLVVSDHGARSLRGGICINEWLIEHGYLVLRTTPDRITPWAELDVDWARTRAWGEGGYHARICLNVRGREPQGTVEPAEVQPLTAAIARELAELPGPGGERLQHRIVAPADVYTETRGAPPELMVFFDDLGYRALASVGHRSLYSPTNDTGPDACNHDWHGIFILAGPGVRARGRQADLNLTDVAPTILGLFGLPHAELRGRDRSQDGALA